MLSVDFRGVQKGDIWSLDELDTVRRVLEALEGFTEGCRWVWRALGWFSGV